MDSRTVVRKPSIVAVRGPGIDTARLALSLETYETTSGSAVLLGSIDAARRLARASCGSPEEIADYLNTGSAEGGCVDRSPATLRVVV